MIVITVKFFCIVSIVSNPSASPKIVTGAHVCTCVDVVLCIDCVYVTVIAGMLLYVYVLQ